MWGSAPEQCMTTPVFAPNVARMPKAKTPAQIEAETAHLPNNLRKYRLLLGLSTTEVAEPANTQHQQISKLELGRLGFDDNWATRLAPILKRQKWELFKDTQRGAAAAPAVYGSISEDDAVALMVNKFIEIKGAAVDDATLLKIRREMREMVKRLR